VVDGAEFSTFFLWGILKILKYKKDALGGGEFSGKKIFENFQPEVGQKNSKSFENSV